MAIGDGVSAIAQLAMTFGGFSPTAMDGVEATRKQIARVKEHEALKRDADRRKREIERARASAPKTFTDEQGMTWTYVVMDESFVRIDKCKRERAQITIPASIEGLPVRALGSDVFHESDVVEQIVCPDSIELIGSCAFRLLANVRRVVFPAKVSAFSGSWLQHCDSLEELVLPGLLEEITASVFESPLLRKLQVGRAVMGVKQGACERTALEELTIDPENPYITTDGDGIYTSDGKELIALARPVQSYRVMDGCERLGRKCCMGIASLASVELPESLQVVGEYAFAHTGLLSAVIPPSVRVLGARSFFHCAQLEDITLSEGLETIEDAAFAESALKGISIPASITMIGSSITEGTGIVHSGPESTFSISPQCESLFFDGEGGLYRREADGNHFIQLIDRDEVAYTVADGTAVIDEYSFAFHDKVERVVLPEGVAEIRRNAFRICANLREVVFPETLRTIGEKAFLDTMLESLYLPACFEELADDALVTAGAHRLGVAPSLREIVVHPDNPRFYVESGLLCRRGETGDRGIVFNDDVADVVIPPRVTTIADFAFNNARNVRTFAVGPNLKTIGTSGLSTWCWIENIHIEVDEPVEGRTVFDFRFPDTSKSAHEISISLGGSSWINVPDIMKHYDNCLANAHDYNGRDTEGISAYEQVRLILARLKDPILLTPVNRSVFERMIRDHLMEMSVDVARHDDREVITELIDFGAIHADNIDAVIAEVGRIQDAAMTGFLLEQKRVRFARQAIDFDL